jgi:hypothetical protein
MVRERREGGEGSGEEGGEKAVARPVVITNRRIGFGRH